MSRWYNCSPLIEGITITKLTKYSQGATEKILGSCGYVLTTTAEVGHMSDGIRQGDNNVVSLTDCCLTPLLLHAAGIESHVKQMTRRSLRALCIAHADFSSIGKQQPYYFDVVVILFQCSSSAKGVD
jgi:hypothetical protein